MHCRVCMILHYSVFHKLQYSTVHIWRVICAKITMTMYTRVHSYAHYNMHVNMYIHVTICTSTCIYTLPNYQVNNNYMACACIIISYIYTRQQTTLTIHSTIVLRESFILTSINTPLKFQYMHIFVDYCTII